MSGYICLDYRQDLYNKHIENQICSSVDNKENLILDQKPEKLSRVNVSHGQEKYLKQNL